MRVLFLFSLCVCCASANDGFGGIGNNGGTDGGFGGFGNNGGTDGGFGGFGNNGGTDGGFGGFPDFPGIRGFRGFGNNGGTDGGNGNDGGCPFAGLKRTECHDVNGARKRQKKICNNNKQWEVVESDDGGADCGGFGGFGNNGGTNGGYGGKRAAKPSLFLSKLVRDEDSQQQK